MLIKFGKNSEAVDLSLKTIATVLVFVGGGFATVIGAGYELRQLRKESDARIVREAQEAKELKEQVNTLIQYHHDNDRQMDRLERTIGNFHRGLGTAAVGPSDFRRRSEAVLGTNGNDN